MTLTWKMSSHRRFPPTVSPDARPPRTRMPAALIRTPRARRMETTTRARACDVQRSAPSQTKMMAGEIRRFIACAPFSRAAHRHGRERTNVGAHDATPLKHRGLAGLCPGREVGPSPGGRGRIIHATGRYPFVPIRYTRRDELAATHDVQATGRCEVYLRSVSAPNWEVAGRVDPR